MLLSPLPIEFYQSTALQAGYTMSESDELRKAISKKQKDKLEKHKEKFIKGAAGRGIMPEVTAEAIFADWEEFARYGFNKSHAADYGVISVQTAFLKTHYTVEYMTALLSAEKNDTAKVALYAADCRSMGIDVLPPDVNTPAWDFTIEDRAGRGPAIRFGLGAIKNVGQGPVDLIIAARREGPFSSLNDFTRRVDLRTLGKRSLECLIKVGAFDSFGPRSALLQVMDQMIAISSSYFKAASSGQMSLFGAFAAVIDDIELPFASSLDNREQLEWERELLGLYVSNHPLSPYLEALKRKITHFAGQLGEAHDREKVTVAGMVTRFRHHQTKDGKAMGFVTLEDVQGPLDLVLFPRTWERYNKHVAMDRVLVAEGKIDAGGGDPKILVDKLEEADLSSVGVEESAYLSFDGTGGYGDFSFGGGLLEAQDAPAQEDASEEETNKQPVYGISTANPPANAAPVAKPAKPASMADDPWGDEELLPPEFDQWPQVQPAVEELLFVPKAWAAPATKQAEPAATGDSLSQNVEAVEKSAPVVVEQQDAQANVESKPEPARQDSRPIPSPMGVGLPLFEIEPSWNVPEVQPKDEPPQEETPAPRQRPAATPPAISEIQAPLFLSAPFLLVTNPLAEAGSQEESEPRMVTIILRSTQDKERDVRRLKRIYGMLQSCPGQDKFSFMVFEHGRRFLLEFPNDTTGISAELLRRLIALVGEGNVSVDKIKIQ